MEPETSLRAEPTLPTGKKSDGAGGCAEAPDECVQATFVNDLGNLYGWLDMPARTFEPDDPNVWCSRKRCLKRLWECP